MSSDHTIEISRLRVQYPERDLPAIADLSEQVQPGETIVIAGPSGSGKSTVCRVLSGFIPGLIPATVSGEVQFAGRSVWETGQEVLAASIGLVQQDPDSQICTLNVWQEIAFGPENLGLPREEIRQRVETAIRAVGAENLVDRNTTTLSGGEKQRVALASILAMRPRVLLLDEPTANLDPAGARDLFELIRRMAADEGTSLVIVEHRLRPLLILQPRLVVMDRGQVVERRTHREHLDLGALGLRGTWQAQPRPVQTGAPLLQLRNLTFEYGSPLLRDVSIDLPAGQILGIIGPNGGGKTTLLRLIAGLEEPRSGTIGRSQETRIGFVFQHPHHQIFERTVRSEILLDGPLSEDRLIERLREARLLGLDQAAPLSLSLGEQRRLTLVTALSRDPDLLLLDEPFIGQDRRNVIWILSRMEEIRAAGGGLIVVSHDTELLSTIADRLLFVDHEETIFGDPSTVFERLRQSGRDVYCPEADGEAHG